jgi:hypothetical protein
LDRPEDAVYWLHVLLEFGGRQAQRTAAKQLWVMAAEDIDDTQIVLRAYAVFQMAGHVPERDHLVFLVAAMCSARKWWEHPEGQLTDHWWAKAEGDLRDPTRRKPIPTYALDRHTRRGWERLRAGLGFDDRFSGTEVGRMKTLWLFTRRGRLAAEDEVDEAAFWEFWRDRRDLAALGPRDVDEPPSGHRRRAWTTRTSSHRRDWGSARLLAC